MGSLLGKHQIAINTASLAEGDSIASYLVDAAGALITSSLIGSKQSLDTNDISSHLQGTAYAAGSDYLMSAGVVDSSGNWVPFTLNASGELPVSATVNFPGDYAEDSAHVSGDVGLFTLLVRQDTLAASTSTDGDYGAFKSNNLGELYVHDTDVKAQLVSANSTLTNIKSDTAAIVVSTASIDTKSTTIASNTGTTATNTGTIASTLTALSKAEDAVHSSGDQGIQALAVRKDAQGSNAADGDYTSVQTWSEGSLKVVDVANGAILQQQVAVSTTAAQVPAANLASRKSLMLQNTGSSKVWIGSATLTSTGAASGIELPANSFMELECGPAVAVFAKTNAGSGQLNVLEMA